MTTSPRYAWVEPNTDTRMSVKYVSIRDANENPVTGCVLMRCDAGEWTMLDGAVLPRNNTRYLLEQFRRDWEATLCPSVEEYLARSTHPDALAAQLDTFLASAPTPAYSARQLARFKEKVQAANERHR